jgi:RNA polymerase sigma factor for flagellar operon FliA
VLSLHYVEGLTYREIARVLEVSEPRVCQLHGEAMRLLRGAVAEEAA